MKIQRRAVKTTGSSPDRWVSIQTITQAACMLGVSELCGTIFIGECWTIQRGLRAAWDGWARRSEPTHPIERNESCDPQLWWVLRGEGSDMGMDRWNILYCTCECGLSGGLWLTQLGSIDSDPVFIRIFYRGLRWGRLADRDWTWTGVSYSMLQSWHWFKIHIYYDCGFLLLF